MSIGDKRYRLPTYTLPIGGKWRKIEEKWMRDVLIDESPDDYVALDDLIYRYQINPLAFSLAHGAKRKDKHGNDGTAFLNNWTDGLITMSAGNQRGKSFIAATKLGLHILPCDPDWPCFKEHGIEFHEWAGPQRAIVASYRFEPNVKTVWETILKIFPRHELGNLAPNWGSFPGEKGQPRVLGFKQGAIDVKLACGSEIKLLSYHQSLAAFESTQCDICLADEQIPEDKYDAITARQITRGDYTPVICAMTPHVVPGMPNTGAAGWITRKVFGKTHAKGRSVANYKITTESVPEVFMSKEKKAEEYEHHIAGPMRENDDIALRHGRSRYYGEPEAGGGGILAAFNPAVHMIEPFDVDKYRPTWMRFVDHGTKPCAAINVALMPWGDMVVVDEYYEWNPSTRVHAQQLVEKFCGNERRQVSTFEEDGATWPVFEEICTMRQYFVSELDGNSFNSPSVGSSLSIGQLYNQSGYRCTPASHPHREKQGVVDILKDMLSLDENKIHINQRLNRDIPEPSRNAGAPSIYFFNHCKNISAEILGWIENPRTGKAMDGSDHLISCLLFMVSKPRRYMGDYMLSAPEYEGSVSRRSVDPYSKY
jgi:hypothetical protein